MCFRTTIPDSRARRRNCRIDPAAKSSRLLRPPPHDQKKTGAEAPRTRMLNELAADLIENCLASWRPRSSDRDYSSDLEIGVTRKPHVALFAVHLRQCTDRRAAKPYCADPIRRLAAVPGPSVSFSHKFPSA